MECRKWNKNTLWLQAWRNSISIFYEIKAPLDLVYPGAHIAGERHLGIPTTLSNSPYDNMQDHTIRKVDWKPCQKSSFWTWNFPVCRKIPWWAVSIRETDTVRAHGWFGKMPCLLGPSDPHPSSRDERLPGGFAAGEIPPPSC